MKSGTCLDIWDGEEIRAVVVLGEEKGRLRVVTGQGREMKIPDARVANHAERTLDPTLAPSVLGKLLGEHEATLEARGAALDLPSLWEVLVDEGGSYTLADLSELALGSRDGDARAALLRRLVRDSLHFARKKLDFTPRTRAEMGETLKRKSAEEEKARRRAEFITTGRAHLATGTAGAAPAWARGSDRFLGALEDLAVRGLESDRIKEALGLLEDLGLAGRGEPPVAAFEALVRFGVFGRDENLLLRKYHIAREFPPEVLLEAERLAAIALPDEPGRRDLRGLECHTIDDADTSEIDDALSLEELDGGRARLGVHIAEPGAWIEHGSPVDLGARDRATTFYLPEERILMLPPVLSEGIASLAAGCDRPALSFLVELDSRGEVLGSEICISTIRIAGRLTYEQADQAIAAGGGAPAMHEAWDAQLTAPSAPAAPSAAQPPDGMTSATAGRLARMARLARARLERRAEAGALVLKGPDLSIRVRDGGIELKRFEPWTPSWVLVSEAMILANSLAADKLAGAGVPAIYRRQAAPDKKLEIPAIYEPAAAAVARKGLKRTEIGLTPGPHAGLGLARYLQITSPLRRYQDLACQRQMKAHLAGQPPPFDTEALWAIAQATDEAEKQAREVERTQREYWLLRYLEGLPPETPFEATITRPEERRTMIELSDLVYVTSIPPRAGHKPGRKIRVVVDAVNPRAGRLVLREVSGG